MTSVVGANIKRLREARGWSQARLAREVCRLASLSGDPIGRQEISRYETGRRTPREWLPLIAEALGVTVDELKTPRSLAGSTLSLPTLNGQRKDDYALTIRQMSQRLVALDNEMHGLPIADLAARSFKTVHRRLGDGDYDPKYERDIQSAAAELAEIAGWALCNEGKFSASRRFSQEALCLAKLSGDRSTELITLQNIGLLAGWNGRPREELAIARSVIDSVDVTPRVEAMFRGREAQGLALAGGVNSSDAVRIFDRARSLLQDSVPDNEPSWAWWVTEREIDRQHGRALQESGQWRAAIPILQRAMEPESGTQVGYRNIAAVRLLSCLLEVGAWQEAEEEAGKLSPAVSEMSSVISLNLLAKVANKGKGTPAAPRNLKDALHHIEAEISEDPYDI
ncbi:helix-turn-helix domain-containing protein [Streptomyces sp. WMMC905]|uniref:helix-turn-helix domain-containing protein n=1 Tax=Streptomyces sp. WMMC905 TaxID=3404123 RepID=UPI003B930760